MPRILEDDSERGSTSTDPLFYVPAGVFTLYSLLPPSLTPSARATASRALLRRQSFQDGEHFLVRNEGGLHPSYLALHGTGGKNTKQELRETTILMEESLHDALDALTALDRIDGGITLLLRSPGYQPSQETCLNDVTVDVYISPRELAEGGLELRSAINAFVQAFGHDIVIAHLQHFVTRCHAESVRPPKPPSPGMPTCGFPDTEACPPGSSHFRYRCRCSSRSQNHIITRTELELQAPLPQTAPKDAAPPSAGASSPINIMLPAVNRASHSRSIPATPAAAAIPIISIGPSTDSALDRLGLDDALIPQLHELVTTVRSSMWEAKLRTMGYGALDFEQASTLANALKADIHVAKVLAQPRSSFLSTLAALCVAFLLTLVGYYLAI